MTLRSERAQEWEGIFEPMPSRPALSRQPRMVASVKLIREVSDALGLADDQARDAADWIADKMERFGASTAIPCFDLDGNGPMCSWCGAIWPLCGHYHDSVRVPDDDEGAAA